MGDDKKRKLKPIVYSSSARRRRNQNNTFQQMLLLKALHITSDPKELKKMIGAKTVAEVYRTFDKLSMRREYHAALARLGIDFTYILNGIKRIADEGEKDSDKLNAFKTLLKSVGMDNYNSDEGAVTNSWEDELMKSLGEGEAKGDSVAQIEASSNNLPVYDVKVPEMPESVRKARETEKKLTEGLYDEI